MEIVNNIERGDKMTSENIYRDGLTLLNVQPIYKNVNNSFTYECWVKPEGLIRIVKESPKGVTGTRGQGYIIGPGHTKEDESAGIGLSIGINGIAVFEHTSNHLPALLVYQTTLTDWTHIAIVFKEKVPYLYINGEFKRKGIGSQKEFVYASGTFFRYDPYGFYKGQVKIIRIWIQALELEKIRNNMSANIKSKEEGLIYQWRFDKKNISFSNYSLPSPDTGPMLKNKKILFVLSGSQSTDMPYLPIEKSILNSLKTMVKDVYTASPHQDILQITLRKNPDLILVFHGFEFSISKIQSLSNQGYKTALWLVDDPYYTDITRKFVPYYDYIFTLEKNCLPFYKSLGCKQVYHLLLGADVDSFYPREVEPKYKSDILFIGSAFWNRVNFFNEITHYLLDKNVLLSGLWWDRLEGYDLLKEKIQLNHWMSPEETAKFYNGAKIVINLHRSHDDPTYNKNSENIKASSLNPRTFEISSCGAFQLTDNREGLRECFTPGYDIETYTNSEDLVKKINYYLEHDDKRNEIARRALNNVRNYHTFKERIKKLLYSVFS